MLRIALRMLIGDATKSLGVVLGVFFCTFLITHMLSMVAGMLQRTYALISDIPAAEIWVMDPATEYVDEPAGLPPTALDRVRGVEGVAWAMPLFANSLRARLPSGRFRSVLMIGVDDATLIGLPSKLEGGRPEDLRRADAVIVDLQAAQTLLRMPIELPARHPGINTLDLSGPSRPLAVGDELMLNDHRAVVVGIADLGPRFLARSMIYTTYTRALEMSPPERNLLSFVLVASASGTNPEVTAANIERETGLRARTASQFSTDTFWYYVEVSGVVSRILFMTSLAVVVGVSISALLLYLFTMENARYYVTLLALGARTRTVISMVALQAAICGALGYGLGTGVSSLLGHLIKSPAMPYLLMWQTLALTAVVVIVVSTVSAALSSLQILRLDTSTVFKT
jgi:putative ABC transport system permease protein